MAQNFSRGYTIFWSASTGAHPVYVKGALGTAYLKNQGQWGSLWGAQPQSMVGHTRILGLGRTRDAPTGLPSMGAGIER